VQEALPRSTKQEDYLGHIETRQEKTKEVATEVDVGGEA